MFLAREKGVSPNQLRKWERQLDDLLQPSARRKFYSVTLMSKIPNII